MSQCRIIQNEKIKAINKRNLNHGKILIVLEKDNTDITDTAFSGTFTSSPSNEPTPTKSNILENQGMV